MGKFQLGRWQRFLQRYGLNAVWGHRLPKGRLTAFLRNVGVRGFYPRHVLDVGANRARWSAKVHAVFPDATLTLVEPLDEMKPHLDAFCARIPKARWIHAAAGAENGERPFTVRGPTDSALSSPGELAAPDGLEIRTVEVVTIDHLVADVVGAVPDLIKLDVEGHEFEALRGASSCLGQTELVVLEIPFWDLREEGKILREAVLAMGDYGYEVYDFVKFQRRKYDAALGQTDIVFARRDGFLRAYKGWR